MNHSSQAGSGMSVALALLDTLMETQFDRERLSVAKAPTLLHLEGSEARDRGLASLRVNMHVRERDCMFVSIRNMCGCVRVFSGVTQRLKYWMSSCSIPFLLAVA